MESHGWQPHIWEYAYDEDTQLDTLRCVTVTDGRGGYWDLSADDEEQFLTWVEETAEEHAAHGGDPTELNE